MLMKRNLILLLCLLIGGGLSFAQGLVREVNMFWGTSGDHGQLSPAACVPFGMVQVGPDSNPRQHAGYDYAETRISGISVNRLSGVGGQGCGGNVSLYPDLAGAEVRMVKQTEAAEPGYYRVCLSNGVEVELTATRVTACYRFVYPSGGQSVLTVNPLSSFEKVYGSSFEVLSAHEAGGSITSANTCGNGKYTLYYYLHADAPFRGEADGFCRKLMFGSEKEIEVRIALSSQSIEHARERYLKEESLDFDAVRRQASAAWDEILSRIQVKGGSDDDRTLFYTALCRTCHSPFQVTSEGDEVYTATDGRVYRAEGFDYYSSWSLWDTYRTKFPLLTLLVPERMADMMRSLARLYVTGKRDWSTDHECVPTVRTEHAIPLLLDSHLKGIGVENLADAYEGMKREAESLSLSSPDRCMEAVTDWWALSRMADILNNKGDAARYARMGDSLFCAVWAREFKDIDSSFVRMRRNGLYQGTRWQYRWAAPQYLDRMIEMVGRDSLEAQLTEFFARDLYNQGNEPDIHVPFLFNRLGSPEKTQATVRRILTVPTRHIYGGNAEYPSPFVGRAFRNAPDGFCPEMDEDDGAMSAWYVFSAMGIYPLVVGEPFYELASPLFDEVTLSVAPGKKFVIRAVNRKDPAQSVREVRLNGRIVTDFRLAHADIVKGGLLEFVY